MTTPYKRPKVSEHIDECSYCAGMHLVDGEACPNCDARGFCINPYYEQAEADAIFESLETELADTRRALERLRDNAKRIFDKVLVRDWAETLAEADAVLERGQ